MLSEWVDIKKGIRLENVSALRKEVQYEHGREGIEVRQYSIK